MTALAAATALLVSFLLTGMLIEPLRRRGLVDVPNERSSHHRPTPRGGGVAVLAGLLVGGGTAAAVGALQIDPALPVGLLLIAVAGLADDLLGGISRWARLGIQTSAALLVVVRLGGLEALPLPAPADLPSAEAGAVLAVVWIVGLVNLTNFLDGIDGLAAGQGLIAGTGLAIAGLLRPSGGLVVVGALLAAACLGFLPFNRHPARVFLGDVGSSTIGFTVAIAPWSVAAPARAETAFLAAMLVWYFIADGTWTLLARALRGEPFWQAHRQHLYQRLVRSGLDHDRVVRHSLGPCLLPASVAVLGYGRGAAPIQWLALVIAVAVFAIVFHRVVSAERLASEGGEGRE